MPRQLHARRRRRAPSCRLDQKWWQVSTLCPCMRSAPMLCATQCDCDTAVLRHAAIENPAGTHELRTYWMPRSPATKKLLQADRSRSLTLRRMMCSLHCALQQLSGLSHHRLVAAQRQHRRVQTPWDRQRACSGRQPDVRGHVSLSARSAVNANGAPSNLHADRFDVMTVSMTPGHAQAGHATMAPLLCDAQQTEIQLFYAGCPTSSFDCPPSSSGRKFEGAAFRLRPASAFRVGSAATPSRGVKGDAAAAARSSDVLQAQVEGHNERSIQSSSQDMMLPQAHDARIALWMRAW